jgi:hypothetical protein
VFIVLGALSAAVLVVALWLVCVLQRRIQRERRYGGGCQLSL